MSGLSEFRIDIPKPPSVNRMTMRLGNSSPVVKKWRAVADGYLRAAGKWALIAGPYEMELMYPAREFGKYDPSNRLKPLEDWLQDRLVIENDRLAKRIIIHWSTDIHEGCRVIVRPKTNA